MSKKRKIFIGDRPLYTCTVLEVVAAVTHWSWKRFDTRPTAPAYFNRDLLAAFGSADERTTSEIIAAWPRIDTDWSEPFKALRVGEGLGWALQEGIVERVFEKGRMHSDRWHLIHANLQFEIVGSGSRERAIRIHNAGDAQAENTKLWHRELKVRERRRAKRIAEMKPRILREIARICRIAPEFDIATTKTMAGFAVGDVKTITACRELIEDSIDEMTASAAYDLDVELMSILLKLDRDNPIKIDPPASAEAVAELDDFGI